jgi:hypothetical protein
MNAGKAIVSGLIGAGSSLVAMWLVFGVFDVPFVMINVYIGVAIAGFFSAFFAIVCNCTGAAKGAAKD